MKKAQDPNAQHTRRADAIYPQRHHLSAKVTAFIEFLIARFKDPRIFELPAD